MTIHWHRLVGITIFLILAEIALPGGRAISQERSIRPSVAELMQRARQEGRLSVIIELRLPPEIAAAAERDPLVINPSTVTALTERVLAAVPANHVRIIHTYAYQPIIAADVTPEGLEALLRLPEVEDIVADRLEPPALIQSVPQINADRAWSVSNGNGRVVAILDTGIDKNHPFFSGRIVAEACFRSDGRCPNGTTQQTTDGAAHNIAQHHGTHVAGIAAGANGRWGTRAISGVAPGAQLVPINVFSGGGASVRDQVKALDHVQVLFRQHGIRIVAVNMSLGGGRHFSACDNDVSERQRVRAIRQLWNLGVATVVAAGNNGWNNAVTAPGCISIAVTVSNVDKRDRIAADNRSELTDFMAPGVSIRSSFPDDNYAPEDSLDDYRLASGTSMATPHVAGAIAVISGASPNASIGDIVQALRDSGREIVDSETGMRYRRIDVHAAIQRLQRPDSAQGDQASSDEFLGKEVLGAFGYPIGTVTEVRKKEGGSSVCVIDLGYVEFRRALTPISCDYLVLEKSGAAVLSSLSESALYGSLDFRD